LDSATTAVQPASFELIILITLHQTMVYAVSSHNDSPHLLQPPDKWYRSQLLQKIRQQLYLNAVFHLSRRDQSYCVFPIRGSPNAFMNVMTWGHCPLEN